MYVQCIPSATRGLHVLCDGFVDALKQPCWKNLLSELFYILFYNYNYTLNLLSEVLSEL